MGLALCRNLITNLPPQITRHPNLHRTTYRRRRTDNSPGNNRTLGDVEYAEGKV